MVYNQFKLHNHSIFLGGEGNAPTQNWSTLLVLTSFDLNLLVHTKTSHFQFEAIVSPRKPPKLIQPPNLIDFNSILTTLDEIQVYYLFKN
jgi:hypothetical protein